jgi:hypothetical protein
MDQAFQVFLTHWMKEENEMKKARFFVKIMDTCEKILENRVRIRRLEDLAENFQRTTMFGEPAKILEVMFQYQQLSNELVHRREIYGICEFCERGVARFQPSSRFLIGSAICSHCQRVVMRLDDISFW